MDDQAAGDSTSPEICVPAPSIAVAGLTKSYGAVRAVDGISFSVAPGETAALLGANGAGKTTTISMLIGLLVPDSGSVTVLGEDMLRHRYRVLGRINLSSPYVDLPRRLTVEENLKVFGRLYGIGDIAGRIEELSEELDLGPLLRRPSGALSSGQRSRMALAKALINRPDVLFLDEPTASLDPDTADRIRTYLSTYMAKENATILLASHNMSEVERMCTKVMIMRAGRIVHEGTPGDLIQRFGRSNLEEVFLDIARDQAAQ
ncbi:MAG TPA: ABC transporter ATP-binding protein [Alphaproteobacteria bacterium]|nr:ABC transporter ATP-binding protein [Alphaproteobacteria bacterium]